MKKTDKSFTTTLMVKQAPNKVFDAINNVRGWWSGGIEGVTDKMNGEFLQYYQDIHIAKMKIIEITPFEKVKWLVLDSQLSFIKKVDEWNNTEIIFEISKTGDQTRIVFTHAGLAPVLECYDLCNDAWSELIHVSLYKLITTGEGQPNPKEKNRFNRRNIKKWVISNSPGA